MTELLRVSRVFDRVSCLYLPVPEPALLAQLHVAADVHEGGLVLGQHLVIRPGNALVLSLEVGEVLPELRQLVLQPVKLLADISGRKNNDGSLFLIR